MDLKTRALFVAHIERLVSLASEGDDDAAKSLACMALIAEGWDPSAPDDPGGGEVIDLAPYLKLAA
jgi:hypothetical protein